MNSKNLFNCFHPKPDASCRLVCFPWAGGGSRFYANWGKTMGEHVEVCAVRMPGRETRLAEPSYGSIGEATDDFTDAIAENYLDKPLAFFGHSLGAALALMVALKLKDKHQVQPTAMFISGLSAPCSKAWTEQKTEFSKMTEKELINYTKKLGGTPPEVLENEELQKLFLPVIRQDYVLFDQITNFSCSFEKPPLMCSLEMFDGKDDTSHDLKGWKNLTCGFFSVTMLPGGHFYLKEPENTVKIIDRVSFSLKCIGMVA